MTTLDRAHGYSVQEILQGDSGYQWHWPNTVATCWRTYSTSSCGKIAVVHACHKTKLMCDFTSHWHGDAITSSWQTVLELYTYAATIPVIACTVQATSIFNVSPTVQSWGWVVVFHTQAILHHGSKFQCMYSTSWHYK